LKSDVLRQVGTGVQGARALAIIACLEGVLEDPVRAARGSLEAASGAVAGIVYSVAEEEIDFSNDTSDINTLEVSNASAIVGRRLEVWELVLGDLPFADGVIVVCVASGEHVDVAVGVVTLVANAEALEGGAEDG